jgi:hypothetical protein
MLTKIKIEYRTNTLALRNLNKEQSGVYMCKASNKHGFAKSSFALEILCNNNLKLFCY